MHFEDVAGWVLVGFVVLCLLFAFTPLQELLQ